jgi:hypothetical protein
MIFFIIRYFHADSSPQISVYILHSSGTFRSWIKILFPNFSGNRYIESWFISQSIIKCIHHSIHQQNLQLAMCCISEEYHSQFTEWRSTDKNVLFESVLYVKVFVHIRQRIRFQCFNHSDATLLSWRWVSHRLDICFLYPDLWTIMSYYWLK